MKAKKGMPLPLGVSQSGKGFNFSVAVPRGQECELLLYREDSNEPFSIYSLKEEDAVGEVRSAYIADLPEDISAYRYKIGGQYIIDPYAGRIVGRGSWRTKM